MKRAGECRRQGNGPLKGFGQGSPGSAAENPIVAEVDAPVVKEGNGPG